MPSTDTKKFFNLMKKLRVIGDVILKDRGSDKDKMRFALCLTEIYFSSHAAMTLIKKISKTPSNLKQKELDALLTDLVYLKIYCYDEISVWMKKLKKPLQQSIDGVEDMLVKSHKKRGCNFKQRNRPVKAKT